MDTSSPVYKEEKAYLDGVLAFLNDEIASLREQLDGKKQLLFRTRKDEGVLRSDPSSPGTSSDLSQHLLEDERQLNLLEHLSRLLERDERLVPSPYFGRFDFAEDGERSPEKVYVGLHNIYDSEGDGDILVYDWRAPISGIFYRCEPGPASFLAPGGEISGSVSLKRQYSIERSVLKYFFDSGLVINDEILQNVLAQNASPKMQNIVRTIQSEQDKIIRDSQSDLLIAQGAAGSGKTSIALHRIAYLLYASASTGLKSSDIVIISLSDVFGRYIDGILPQLGEENVAYLTFDAIAEKLTGLEPALSREAFFDALVEDEPAAGLGAAHQSYLFKGSRGFGELLSLFLSYYIQNCIDFKDVFYGDTVLSKGDEQKKALMGAGAGAPPLSRLRRLATIVKSRMDRAQPALHRKLEGKYSEKEGHQFDYRTVAREEAIKEAQKVQSYLDGLTGLSASVVYRELFADRERFLSLCRELSLEGGEAVFDHTAAGLGSGFSYDDMAPLSYLSLLLDRCEALEGAKHVVVDEAQDYLPLQYAVLGRLYRSAAFTVLGDVGQSVATPGTEKIYDDATELLKKRRPARLNLQKSYRCSCEIMELALKIPEVRPDIIPFERHEKAPELVRCNDAELAERLAADIASALGEGFDTVAVIAKTERRARELYGRLLGKAPVRLLENGGEVGHGAMILSAHLAKGLEFDCALVPDVDDEHYGGVLSRRLLYIACTRALHRLSLYSCGDCALTRRLES